jgi:sec-independent protein translocase protein TatC
MKVPGWLRQLRQPGDRSMSFWDHLEELRKVVLSSLAAIIGAAVAIYFFSGRILEFLVVHTVGQAQFLRPMEGFTVRLKLSLLLGLIVALPFVFFRIWSFIVPGLMQRERRTVFPLSLWSTLLFLIGVAFASFLLTPIMVKFLMGFQTEHIEGNLAISYLLDFFMKMALACGVLFQLPLVVAILSIFEILTPAFLKQKWRHAVVLILILSAILTPSDPGSQLVLSAPVMLLYIVSIVISTVIWKRKASREIDHAETDS